MSSGQRTVKREKNEARLVITAEISVPPHIASGQPRWRTDAIDWIRAMLADYPYPLESVADIGDFLKAHYLQVDSLGIVVAK